MALSSVFVLTLFSAPATVDATPREQELFNKLAKPLIARDSWNDALAYASGQYFLIPLESAYQRDIPEWQNAFRDHVARLLKVDVDSIVKNPLSKVQYLYPISRFVTLEAKTFGHTDLTKKTEKYLSDFIIRRWNSDNAIAYDSPGFRGVKARIDHKLGLRNPRVSYYEAITDEELFTLAIAAELKASSKIAGSTLKGNRDLDSIVNYAQTILRKYGQDQPGGGWQFQPGAWSDHPDNAYAGVSNLSKNMRKSGRSDVAWDTSHFHRFASFIRSYRDAEDFGSSDYRFFDNIRTRFTKQFVSNVLVKPTSAFPGYRTTNYLDGWNGVYRYGLDKTLGPNKGYGPYQLSGTFLLGWWSLLGDPEITKAYQFTLQQFPLNSTLLETYEGPMYDPARLQKSWYQNGWAELLVSLASTISAPPATGKDLYLARQYKRSNNGIKFGPPLPPERVNHPFGEQDRSGTRIRPN